MIASRPDFLPRLAGIPCRYSRTLTTQRASRERLNSAPEATEGLFLSMTVLYIQLRPGARYRDHPSPSMAGVMCVPYIQPARLGTP